MPKRCTGCGGENVIQAKTCRHCGKASFKVDGVLECPKCYYEPSDEADLRKHLETNHHLTPESVVVPAPAHRPKKERSEAANTGVGCAIVIALFLLVAGCAALVDDGDSGTSSSSGGKETKEQPGTPDPEEQQYSAFEACKDFVSQRLKAPGSATFRNFFEDDGEVVVTDEGGNEYSVVSSVDAENSFGAELRTNFVCSVVDKGDTWGLLDLQMDGN